MRDANFVDSITAATASEIDALLRRAGLEYARCPHLRFDLDARTPPEFEARLRLDSSFTCREMLALLLEGDLRATSQPFAVREVVGVHDWEAFAVLHAANWIEEVGSGSDQATPVDDTFAPVMLASLRRKSPPVRYWLLDGGGAARGYCSSWQGTIEAVIRLTLVDDPRVCGTFCGPWKFPRITAVPVGYPEISLGVEVTDFRRVCGRSGCGHR